MSRRDQQGSGGKLPNPAQNRFIEVQGKTGELRYFDKEIGAKGENVNVPLPFFFIILKSFSKVTGYNSTNGGLYSNEVERIDQEPLYVRYFKDKDNLIAQGLYKDIKDRVTSRSVGGKFAKSIYIAYVNADKKLEIANLTLSGKTLYSFNEAMKKAQDEGNNIYDCMFYIKKDGMKFVDGQIPYHYPIFNYRVMDENAPKDKEALDLSEQMYDEVEAFSKARLENQESYDSDKTDSPKAVIPDADTTKEKSSEDLAERPKTEAPEQASPFEDSPADEEDDLPW